MGDLISRQAAIDEIKALYEWHEIVTEDRAIDHFKRLPSAQPECNLDEWCHDCKEYDKEKNRCPRWNRVIRTALEEAQPERKKGKWKKSYADHEAFGVRPFFRYCSECHESTVYAYNYCPNCGADMRGETE